MTVLLVVAKSPVAGRAKTRLCPPASPTQAARIATAALLDTMDAVRATAGATPVLALAGRLDEADGYPGAGDDLTTAAAGWRVLPQRGDRFADRLANAHADVAAAYPGRPVLQIGMDTPQLTGAVLAAAVRTLTRTGGTSRTGRSRPGTGRSRPGTGRSRPGTGRSRPGTGRTSIGRPGAGAVLGWAADGGWWALGLSDPRSAEALRDVPMSTPRTGQDTWAALCASGLSVTLLPLLRDVDEWRDAVAVAETIPGSRFAREVAAVGAERSYRSGQPLVGGAQR
ncbi:DUF2064 domain-containing protein [Solwaraspora sp. WMMD406]|uniref:DUF2064 domain-containing protein n=1 Tax=Solwaraspora sp. WMMD406 TaxID=3016095 RepID=UPI0024178671|nr:DUF2064 domain-containing protein [Solwaraspora sp. WMMD406]MDG4764179.1 DUF2064 domain-containing protein [Solwaraspora sp. WMMD406]